MCAGERIGALGCFVETLERRHLLAGDFATLVSGILTVTGAMGDDAMGVHIDGGSVVATLNGAQLSFPAADVTQVIVNGRAGDDSIELGAPLEYTVNAGSLSAVEANSLDVAAGAHVVFNATQRLSSLAIAGSVALAAGGEKALVTKSLAFTGAGALDLADSDLVVEYSGTSPIGIWTGGTYDGVLGMIKSGRIMSSSAGALHALAVSEAGEALAITGSQTAMFSAQTVDATAVLVKFTWGGDATIDGRINVDDYGRIDGNVAQSGAVFGWGVGDFNLDGKLNVDDYGIIDGNISQQSAEPALLAVSTIAIDFTDVPIDAQASAQVTLTNPAWTGGAAVTVQGTSLNGSSAFSDNFNDAADIVLAPGQSTTVTVAFEPASAGDFAGILSIQHDGANTPINVALSGSGVEADLTLTLINADTDEPLGTLVDGMVINYGLIGTDNINVRADPPAGTQSVRFGYDSDDDFRTENTAPYAMNGDSSGNFAPWTPSVGAHVIKATAYTGDNASGTAGPTLTINVTVVEGSELLANPASVSFSAAQGGTATPKNVTISTSDGTSASYSATSNATWLSVSPQSGNTSQPLVLSINTATLPLGTHQAYVTVKSSTHGPVKFPVTLDITGAFVADQIHLSFVQNPATTLTLVWRTMSTSTPSTVEYRALGNSTWLSATGAQRTSGTSGKLHETTLTGLTAATSYEYRVRGDNSAWSPVFATRTMPAPGPADFEAVYFGDTGLIGRLDGLDTGTAQTIAEIKKLDPELLLPGGDYVYYNTDTRFGTLDNTIDQWFKQNSPIFSRSPIMPTYGNHEVLLGESYDAWRQRFATPNGWNNGRNYSFDVGEAHFISILAEHNNADLSNSSLTWLINDLAAAQAAGKKWIIPFFHVSPFADGSSHPSNLELRAQLGPIFEQYGVKVALASHDQSYERTYPLRNVPNNITRTDTNLSGYDVNDGVTWVKVSPAGKLSNHGGVNDFSKFTTNPKPFYTAYRDDTMHHFSRLVFRADGTLRVETYGFSGDGTPAVIIDSFEYNLGSSADTVGAAQQTAVAKLITSRANGWTWSLADPITFDSLTGEEFDAEIEAP